MNRNPYGNDPAGREALNQERADNARDLTERQERIEQDYVRVLLDKRYGLSVRQPDVFDRWLDTL
jgi:hypothetical protein